MTDKRDKQLILIISAPVLIYFAIAIPYSAVLGWHSRSTIFSAFVREVHEQGGSTIGHSKLWNSLDTATVGPDTDMETLETLLQLAAAGKIDNLVLTQTQITQAEFETSVWSAEINVKNISYAH